jgi:hypothetical protein
MCYLPPPPPPTYKQAQRTLYKREVCELENQLHSADLDEKRQGYISKWFQFTNMDELNLTFLKIFFMYFDSNFIN